MVDFWPKNSFNGLEIYRLKFTWVKVIFNSCRDFSIFQNGFYR